jgi:hypothetical protein
MSRYKGRSNPKEIEKAFPQIVQMIVPLGGFDDSPVDCGASCRHWGRNAGGGGTDDDCSTSFRGATLRAFLRGGGETGPDRGGDDLSCMMSCSTACNVTMFWDIWSCLAASSSTFIPLERSANASHSAARCR